MKKFCLTDTHPDPYFTVEVGGEVIVTIHRIDSDTAPPTRRTSVEIWRDGKILCRVFASSARIANEVPPEERTGCNY